MPSAGYVPFIQSLLCDPISGRPEMRLEHVSPYKSYSGARLVSTSRVVIVTSRVVLVTSRVTCCYGDVTCSYSTVLITFNV